MNVRSFLLLVILLVTATTASYASVLILNNNPSHAGAYATAQAVHDAANNNDTIYCIGSGNNYGDLNASKPLVWIGPGYYLNINPETQANPAPVTFVTMSINPGAAGSYFAGISTVGNVSISSNAILFKRCYLSRWNSVHIFLNASTNITFDQCNLETNYVFGGINTVNAGSAQNISFTNCIIGVWQDGSNWLYTTNGAVGPVVVRNCVIRGGMQSYSTTVTNSIITAFWTLAGDISISNTLCYNTGIPEGNGNLTNVNMDSVFVGGSGDAFYQLRPNSPAIGAGLGGVDCGAFGGPTPYVLSGIPSVPTITFFDSPSSGAAPAGLPVTIRARARN